MSESSVRGPARQRVDATSDDIVPALIAEDVRRQRAEFFDGRFLTARDLTREQQYALIRQSDWARASGGGVASGLRVRRVVNARTLALSPGHGITPAGEAVRLNAGVTIDVRKLPALERLDASFGLARLPGEPVGKRSGLFVVALRPVEFTDHTTVAYPVGIDDRRRLEEGEIVEASAITLIRLEELDQTSVDAAIRAELAQTLFLRGGLRRLSGEALPLAVVALDRGNVAWVDEYLVRRNIRAHDVLSLGLGDRVTREAFYFQFRDHLNDVETARATRGLGTPFAASEAFRVLPPFGPLPRRSVEIRDGRVIQAFFPADMNVEITIVPRDELPAFAEQALALTPFDLLASSDTLELDAVMLLVPMSREAYATKLTELRGQLATTDPRRLVRPTARVLPIEALDALRRQRLAPASVAVAPVDLAPWADALEAADRLFYIRRRQLAQVAPVVPRYPEIGPLDPTNPARNPPLWTAATRARLVAAGELEASVLTRFDFMVRRAPDAVVQRLGELFARSPFDTNSPSGRLLVAAAVAELAFRTRSRLEDVVRAETFPPAPDASGVRAVAGARANVQVRALRSEDVEALERVYPNGDASFGTGLRDLLAVTDGAQPVGSQLDALAARRVLALSQRVRELDALVRSRNTATFTLALARALLVSVPAADLDAIAALATGATQPAA